MPCDIRGQVGAELSPELFETWGSKLGRRLSPGDKFLVGGDVRESTPRFIAALVEGLCREGLDVVDLGLLPTPMIHYAKRRLDAAGCAIVTASHNPATVNGLKWMIGDRPPTPEEVAAMAAGDEHKTTGRRRGGGDSTRGAAGAPADKRAESSASNRAGPRKRAEPRTLDVSFDYVAHLQETFVDSLDAHLHVVLDPMRGAWAAKARRYLHAIFPQCIFSTIRDEPDGAFGGGAPDCSRPENLQELCEAVYHQRAHLGVAFDGDGDRIALVDDAGIAFSPEETAFAMLELFNNRLRGEPVVHDLKLSDRIIEAARHVGAKPLAERSGHAFIRARMREANARLGVEASGHYFFRELGGGEDPLYAACLLTAWLAKTGRKLSDVRRECPPAFITPDLRIAMSEDEQAKTIERIGAAWTDFSQTKTDGLRIETPCGWALVRRSVTEPALTFRFEGLDWHALDDLVERFCDTLPDDLSDLLWSRYQSAFSGGTAR